LISPTKRRKVLRSLVLVDDGRGVAQADKQQVEDQPSGATVAVQERMDLLKAAVGDRQLLRNEPGDSAGVAFGSGSTSQTGVIAIS
jgi:hypothetical protein